MPPTATKPRPKLGLIVGNRGFFPDHLAATGREDMLRVLEQAGAEVVALTTEESKFGAVETFEEAKRCAALFKQHRDTLDGVVVTLPNFGDERAIADTLRLAGFSVPVLVQATPDTRGKMTIRDRRDSLPKTCSGFSASAAWSAVCAVCASDRSERAPRLSTRSATAKSCSRRT